MPEISVIMGVYNPGRFLAATMASLRAQTFRDWELVIVDNGSHDGVLEAELAARPDERVRVLRFAQPLGPGPALAMACREVRGRYVAVLDSDDIALPRRLEIQHAYLELQPGVLLLGTGSDLIDEHDNFLAREPLIGRHEDIYELTAYFHVLRHSSIMFRRELLERVQYRDVLGSGADRDFFAQAVEAGRVEALPALLCLYRVHSGNVSRSGDQGSVSRALVSMLIQRRRHGKPEELGFWQEKFAAVRRAHGTDPAEANLGCARLFAAEGLHELAGFHAWLAMRAGARWRGAARYVQAAVRGLGRNRKARRDVIKNWLKEPAHQLLRAGGIPDRQQF